jgi:hypothetical protein
MYMLSLVISKFRLSVISIVSKYNLYLINAIERTLRKSSPIVSSISSRVILMFSRTSFSPVSIPSRPSSCKSVSKKLSRLPRFAKT